jgi:hypothetical protein
MERMKTTPVNKMNMVSKKKLATAGDGSSIDHAVVII